MLAFIKRQVESALYVEKHYEIINRHNRVIWADPPKVAIFVNCMFFSPAAIAESILEIVKEGLQSVQEKTISVRLAYFHASFLTRNFISIMIANPSHQTRCQISLDEASSRNGSSPREKTMLRYLKV